MAHDKSRARRGDAQSLSALVDSPTSAPEQTLLPTELATRKAISPSATIVPARAPTEGLGDKNSYLNSGFKK
jgi:hypothetical protein